MDNGEMYETEPDTPKKNRGTRGRRNKKQTKVFKQSHDNETQVQTAQKQRPRNRTRNNHLTPKTDNSKAANAFSFTFLPAFENLKRSGSNIWRPSRVQPAVSINSPSNLETLNYDFDVKPIRKPSSGSFYRKRSSRKFISIKTTSQSEKIEPQPSTSTETVIERFDNLEIKKKPRVRTRKPKKLSETQLQLEVERFPEYLTKEEVDKGLRNGTLVKGFIRINPRNSRDAYVTSDIKGDLDYYINSKIDQNRALVGDEVVLKIKPKDQWDGDRRTATVMFISQKVHPRTAVGSLLPIAPNSEHALFFPRDDRFPPVHIPMLNCPPDFSLRPRKYAETLYLVEVRNWSSDGRADGFILEHVGQSGELKVENLAILKSCDLDCEPFVVEDLNDLPRLKAPFDQSVLTGRKDLRSGCVFTIDPATARDLDDAVSCELLPNGNYEIGVHISDVSHFLKDGTALDSKVRTKATTIYMVDQVYHMLPQELCMACSLLPGQDRLAFSVFWEMTSDADVLSTRFAKTAIKSCAQLSYDHAQSVIDDPHRFDRSKFPPIVNGYSVDDLKDRILIFYQLSVKLRKRRFKNGALTINQTKISFVLDPVTGSPISYHPQELKEANRLIEEFMLLSNISVAEKIVQAFPDLSFLRLHEPPKETMMKELKAVLASVGIHLDTSSSKSLQLSLTKYTSDDPFGKIRMAVLNHLLAKPMLRAKYFCSGTEVSLNFAHFALNVPLYTHFTSPIRRYADIMVHRLLAASLGLDEKPAWNVEYVAQTATTCNCNKYNAKRAQEESTKLYLSIYLAKRGPVIRTAAVVDVKQRSFDVLVLELGEVLRVYANKIPQATFESEEILCSDAEQDKGPIKRWRINVKYKVKGRDAPILTIVELFSEVQVMLKVCPTKQLTASLVAPKL